MACSPVRYPNGSSGHHTVVDCTSGRQIFSPCHPKAPLDWCLVIGYECNKRSVMFAKHLWNDSSSTHQGSSHQQSTRRSQRDGSGARCILGGFTRRVSCRGFWTEILRVVLGNFWSRTTLSSWKPAFEINIKRLQRSHAFCSNTCQIDIFLLK